MPDEYRISELTNVTDLNNDDLVEVSQVSPLATSGFVSLKAKITDLANKIINGIQFTSALTTTSKTISGAVNELDGKTAGSIPLGSDFTDPTSTAGAINGKQDSAILNIVKTFTSGSSLDALNSLVTEYGKKTMIFAFNVSGVGEYMGMLTFYSSTIGGGYFINTSGRLWIINYASGTFTLSEKT